MQAKGLSHVSIGVSNMERSLPFYRDVLGLRVAVDAIEQVGSAPNLLSSSESNERRAVYLRWEDGPHVPFIVINEHKGTKPGPGLRIDQVGIHHFSFWVTNLEETYERVKASGAKILVEPSLVGSEGYGEPPGGKILTTIFLDPDGTMLQLDQRADG